MAFSPARTTTSRQIWLFRRINLIPLIVWICVSDRAPFVEALAGPVLSSLVGNGHRLRLHSMVPTFSRPLLLYGSASSSVSADATRVVEFTSPPMSVYIEDTDAYGVIYNSNYLRAYERALQIFFQTPNDELNGISSLEEEAWTVLQVDEQKFKSSPSLGGTFVIQATQCIPDSDDALDGTQVWDMQMKKYQSDDEHNNDNDQAVVYNSAKVTIGKVSDVLGSDWGVVREKLLASTAGSGTKTTTRPTATTTENYNYLLYRDEFDSHLTTHMPLRNVLNLFERSRTNYLGGPDMLRAFQVEHQIVFVVTRVDQCSLVFDPLPPPLPEDGQGKNVGRMARPGQTGTVQTEFLAKRKGMILECHQSLWVEDRCVAQGIVTIMSLSEATRRPTADFPKWFQAKVGL